MSAQAQGVLARRPSPGPPSSGLLHRKCACGGAAGLAGACPECERKRLRRKAAHRGADAAPAPWVPPVVHDALRSPGQSLDPATRGFFESRAWPGTLSQGAGPSAELSVAPHDGPLEREAEEAAERTTRAEPAAGPSYDFSRVRVHADATAARSARAVDALAYAVGDHVVFGAGQYSPGTAVGRSLLAHELAHTIQHGGRRAQLDRQCDPAMTGRPWSDRVTAARAMAGGAARDQCIADMLDEALPGTVTVHQATNGARTIAAAIAAGSYTEWGTLSDLHVNFDRNLNAKTGDPNQYGETQFRTPPGGNTIDIFIVLGPRALDPVGPQHTQMAFEHESGHAWDFLSQWAVIGAGPPHAATPGEELKIFTEGFSRSFLDLWTIDNAAGRFSISDTFFPLFTNFARATPAEQNASFDSIQLFFNVRITPDACNMMKFKIWLQMMQNQRPANDALAARINALPGLGLNRGTGPGTHFNSQLGCA